ncbi:MAG: amino acid permease, partial [Planctomycetota bacterium]
GMVVHHLKEREPGWRRNTVLNGVGATTTFVVLLIVAITKFSSGAWVPVIVIPMIIFVFKVIHRHYERVRTNLAVTPEYRARPMNHTVVVLVGTVHRGVLDALAYARSLNPHRLLAVSVVSDDEEQTKVEAAWREFGLEEPLELVYSPYRELTRPLLTFIDELDAQRDNDIITVVIPEFIVESWWAHVLHNQSALLLKARLLFRKGTVVTSLPYHLD